MKKLLKKYFKFPEEVCTFVNRHNIYKDDIISIVPSTDNLGYVLFYFEMEK